MSALKIRNRVDAAGGCAQLPGIARKLRIRYDGSICPVTFSGNVLMIANGMEAVTGKAYLLFSGLTPLPPFRGTGRLHDGRARFQGNGLSRP